MSKIKQCLQVCVAAISSKLNKQESNDYALIILEIDVYNEYKVSENLDRSTNSNGVRRKASSPMVTKVLFCDCGLIVASFKGYIELYDTVDFVSKCKWDNQTEINNKGLPAKDKSKNNS